MIGSQEGFKLQEEIAMCLLAGLGYLRSKSIIHRNIKLENILLVFNGGGEVLITMRRMFVHAITKYKVCSNTKYNILLNRQSLLLILLQPDLAYNAGVLVKLNDDHDNVNDDDNDDDDNDDDGIGDENKWE